MKGKWTLKRENCTGCRICVDVCPAMAIKMRRTMSYPEPFAGKCTACMTCYNECPFDAILVEGIERALRKELNAEGR